MFYDSATVDYLIDRLGWENAVPPSSIVVSAENHTSTSGRYYDEFFKMSIVENIEAAIHNSDATELTLNEFLFKLKKEAVMNMLDRVFDSNERAFYKTGNGGCVVDISGKDYSAIIPTKGRLFDAAIGYSMAKSVIQLLLTTGRENGTNRDNKFDYNYLKGELEGLKDENGEVFKGINGYLNIEIGKIINILFPKRSTPILTAPRVW